MPMLFEQIKKKSSFDIATDLPKDSMEVRYHYALTYEEDVWRKFALNNILNIQLCILA